MVTDEEYVRSLLLADGSPFWILFLPGRETIDDWQKIFELSEAQVDVLVEFRKIPYDLPFLFPVLEDDKDELLRNQILHKAYQCLGQSNYDEVQDVKVGFSIVDEINASALKTPSGNAAILINNLIFFSYPYISFLIFEYLISQEEMTNDYSLDQLQKDIVMLSLFSSTSLFSMSNSSLRRILEIMRLRPTESEMVLGNMVNLYVILHEFGHILLNHLDVNNTQKLFINEGDIEVEAYNINWDQEFAADAFALECLTGYYELGITKGIIPLEGATIVRGGIGMATCIFFGVLAIKRRLKKSSFNFPSTHPDPWLRWKSLKEQLSPDYNINMIHDVDTIFTELIMRISEA